MFGYKLVKEKDIPFLKITEVENKYKADKKRGLQFGTSMNQELPPKFFILDRDVNPVQLINFNLEELEWLNERINEALDRYSQKR